MDRKSLTVLGCSGSLVLSLLSTNTVSANSSKEYVFTAPVADSNIEVPVSNVDYPFYDCTCSEYDADAIEQIDMDGDKAIELFGCDCAGCRRFVSSLDSNKNIN